MCDQGSSTVPTRRRNELGTCTGTCTKRQPCSTADAFASSTASQWSPVTARQVTSKPRSGSRERTTCCHRESAPPNGNGSAGERNRRREDTIGQGKHRFAMTVGLVGLEPTLACS